MLAQDRHEANDGTGRPAHKRQARRPTKFMFIDSSNGGVNAKPDRVVRSFVMKSARNRKTWSTRPKSPKEEQFVESDSLKQLSSCSEAQYEAASSFDPWSPQSFRKDSLWEDHFVTSPGSSKHGSTYSASRTCDSPPSGHTSPYSEYDHVENAYDPPSRQHTTLTVRDGFDVRFTRPLNCLSVDLDARSQRLLHQFIEGSASRLIPVDIYRNSSASATSWISGCIQNPNGAPYIFAALTASARAIGVKSDVYKWQAITEVNRLLSDPTTNTSDITIAAVLILLALEESDLANPHRQGKEREWSLTANNAHLNGLRTMIEQRGGLAALNTSRCLQVFILMHSIAQCITTFKRPYAVLSDSWGQVEDYVLASHPNTNQSTLAASFHSLCSDPALQTILQSTDIYILDLAVWYNTGCTPNLLDPFDLQKHDCLLKYRLFDWYKTGEDLENAGGSGRTPMDQCICLAHLVCLVIATEPLARSFGLRISKIVVKLRQALHRIPVSHWATAPDALLWIVTMGALGARDLPRSQRTSISELDFLTQYAQLSSAPSQHDEFITANDLLQRLQGFPWIASVFDTRTRRLWAQMGLCMPDVIDMYESSSDEESIAVDDEHALGQSTTARFFPALKPSSKRSSPS